MIASEIFVVGAGRMGRGIAQCYALAGTPVCLVDLKQRDDRQRAALSSSVRDEIGKDLNFSAELKLLDPARINGLLDSIRTSDAHDAASSIGTAELIYEAVPEVMELKQAAFDWISEYAPDTAVVASTTSTLNVDELAGFVSHPGRFLNAHFLNPAHLMPLVEVAVGAATAEASFETLKASITAIGKVPVRCKASPGYIVPRIQALAMNEAARLVEEGVASAEDVDTAVRVGFGLRFAVLGLLEFIDWGGNDILYYASKHMSRTVDADRYRAPEIIEANMKAGRNGLREGVGFYNYEDMDVDAYRRQRLTGFVELIQHLDLLPAGLGSTKTGGSKTHE